MEVKADSYTVQCVDGSTVYVCSLCGRSLSRKQRILSHLAWVHKKSPVKRERKRYLYDPTVPVPKRTARYQAQRKKERVVSGNDDTDAFLTITGSTSQEEFLVGPDRHHGPTGVILSDNQQTDVALLQDIEFHGHSDTDSDKSVNMDEFQNYDEQYLTSSSDEMSCVDSLSESENSSFELSDAENDSETNELPDANKKLSDNELQAYCLVSYILKYKLSSSAGNDLLLLLQTLCPDSECFKNLKYEQLLSNISDYEPKIIHYCCICNESYPDDPDVFRCTKEDCPGLRYEGPISSQSKKDRHSRCFFAIADVESQLKSLFERKLIWAQIQKTKQSVLDNQNPSFVADITDGEGYRDLCKPGGFLEGQNNFSAIFNTDGVPLFNSSKVKLWPIFLCINELPPSQRFARGNTILAALWQGKDKPPFLQYISAFGDVMSRLHSEGLSICPSELIDPVTVHLTVLLASVDLQAKAYLTNMTMHNGDFGCLTCEEKGMTVKQGKGHSHYYPYRPHTERPPLRVSDDLKYVKGVEATRNKRIMGICGVSGLLAFEWFDIVTGVVPDYMHGVLLGVTKALLSKWFSPTQSGKPYFIGKALNKIAKRMGNIKPPDFIERLPRDLEKNYSHFKATELQTWLLFYSMPCLQGYLPNVYLEHFACLSEAIHILLRDKISASDLDRAEKLLNQFYQEYAELYGEGSCGLNVHNIGSHLVYYVRLWGPLFGWSCFGFEDSNAELLNSAHGTGNVIKPVLKMKQVQLQVLNLDNSGLGERLETKFLSKMVPKWRKRWRNLMKCKNCHIAGALFPCQIGNLDRDFFLIKTHAMSVDDLKQVKRVKVGELYLYSKAYSKMSKRISHVVLCNNGNCYSLEYFLYNQHSGIVYAVSHLLELQEHKYIVQNAGHHLWNVKPTLDIHVFEVENIQEKLCYITPDNDTGFVGRIPNQHGHGTFK